MTLQVNDLDLVDDLHLDLGYPRSGRLLPKVRIDLEMFCLELTLSK